MNPFLAMDQPDPWGPGSFEMALPLIDALDIQPGMRVLEIGGGSGQIATTLAKHFGVTVVTLEPWTDGNAILRRAAGGGQPGAGPAGEGPVAPLCRRHLRRRLCHRQLRDDRGGAPSGPDRGDSGPAAGVFSPFILPFEIQDPRFCAAQFLFQG